MTTMDNAPAWYVVRPAFRWDTPREGEDGWKSLAVAELEESGFHVFQPTYTRFSLIRHTKGRRRAVVLPLMPGYLFIKLTGPDLARLDAILNARVRVECRHVLMLFRLTSDRRPPRCNEKVVEQLIEACAEGKFDQGKTRSGSGYLKDDRVLITDGPLAGVMARFKDGRCRPGFIRVVFERLFGKDITATVLEEYVEAA